MARRGRKIKRRPGVPLYMYRQPRLTEDQIAGLAPEEYARYQEQQSVAETTQQARSTRNIHTDRAYSKWQNVYIQWCDGTWPVGCIEQADGTKGYAVERTLLGTESKYLVSGHKLHLFIKNCVLGTGYQRLNEVGYVQQPRKRTKTNANSNGILSFGHSHLI
ncbi:hypothetical protein DFS34DRAFT_589763 [Phlyctochytrium arcticum]|nr:hypothetical protein DFS34DRAFT_589763 [Phlyctochytrium arcticum]